MHHAPSSYIFSENREQLKGDETVGFAKIEKRVGTGVFVFDCRRAYPCALAVYDCGG